MGVKLLIQNWKSPNTTCLERPDKKVDLILEFAGSRSSNIRNLLDPSRAPGSLLANERTDVASLREAWRGNKPKSKDNNHLPPPTASFISPCNLSSIAKASVSSRISNFSGRANSKSHNHIQQAEKPCSKYSHREDVIITQIFFSPPPEGLSFQLNLVLGCLSQEILLTR